MLLNTISFTVDVFLGEEEKPIFGVPLQIAVERSKSHDGIDIPVIVRECIDYIEEHGNINIFENVHYLKLTSAY